MKLIYETGIYDRNNRATFQLKAFIMRSRLESQLADKSMLATDRSSMEMFGLPFKLLSIGLVINGFVLIVEIVRHENGNREIRRVLDRVYLFVNGKCNFFIA